MKQKLNKIFIHAICIFPFLIHGESLLDIYNEALENDPTFRAAQYTFLADKELKVQGRAALLPNISISGSTNWNEYYQNKVLQQNYNSFGSQATLSQPLFRLDYWFNYKSSKALTDAAEADFAYEQQNLLVRTAEVYFGVLRAIDNLNAAISEEKAIKKQLDQAQQRFEVGLSAITEVQESQLAFDLSRAAKINAEGNLFSARESLNALIGREVFSIDELGKDLIITEPTPSSKEAWVNKAIEKNYKLKASHLRKNAAKNNARSSASNHLPKINIAGTINESETNQFNFEGFDIDGQGIPVPEVTGRRNYAIQFSMPIFQGGSVNSKRRQAYANYDKSIENALFVERSVIQEVRSQYSNVITLVANVTAQQQAVVSATSALEATSVGYKVGTRNVVDLLQAEKNLYSAEKNLANAKYDYILANLRLALASGTISPKNIIDINNLLN